MNRHAAAIVVSIGVSIASMPAGGYPIPRVQREIDITSEEPVLSVGAWLVDERGLGLASSERPKSSRLVNAPANGFIRARLTNARGSRVVILFRAAVFAQRPLQLRGYGLVVNLRKGRLDFLRWDEGGVREPGALELAPSLVDRESVEVCIWHGGPSFIGVVYDGVTRQTLATLSWSDTAYAEGLVGLQLAGRGGQDVRVRLQVAPPIHRSETTRDWLSRDWLVVVDRAHADAIPESLASMLLPTRSASSEHAAFITNEIVVHALKDLDIPTSTTQPGVPYAYRDPGFFERARLPIKQTRVGVTFPEGLKDEGMINAILRAYSERFPQQTRLEILGHSVQGRPISALRIADDPDDTSRPSMLLCAAHHANEAITPELVLDAIRYLLERPSDSQVQKWLATFTIIAVPMVNPDGSHAFWHISDQLGRANRALVSPNESLASGVDLNRNYPFRWGEVDTRYNTDVPTSNFYRGESPGSEPEVRAMMQLAERERYAAAISYHAAATKILIPYTSGEQANPEPSAAWKIGEQMISRLPHEFRGRRYQAMRNLYEVNGTDQDWYHHSFGTAAFLLEAPYSTPKRLTQIREVVVHSRPAWQFLLDRWIAGPSLSVRAIDGKTGHPIEAQVVLDEVTLRAGERWSTRPDNGWHHQYLPNTGSYTVRLRAGERQASRTLEIGEEVRRVEVEL